MEKTDEMLRMESTREDAEFLKGFLCLLKETELFGPMIECAIQAADRLIEKTAQGGFR